MTIAFDQIPANWRRKGAYAEAKPRYDRKGLTAWPAKVIILGQLLATGSATALQAYPITRPDQAAGLFGAGSQLAQAITAFKKANRFTEVFALGVADAAGTASVRTLTFTGAPTSSGTLALWIQGRRIPVGVTPTDTVTTIATKTAAAINADTSLGLTATSAAGVVTTTAKHKGTCGSAIDIRLNHLADETTPAGIAMAIAETTPGATDPSLSPVIAALVNDWFTDWVVPWTDSANMALLDAEMTRRYNAMAKLDAHAYTALVGSYAAATTWSSTRNSPFISTLPFTRPLTAPWEIAASLAGVAAFQLTNDPARQLGSLVLPGVLAPASADRYTEDEQNLMLNKGLSTWDAMDDGSVVLNRVVTNYVKTTLAVTDDAWLDIMVPKTVSRIRYDWLAYVQLMYPRHKLADDESPLAADPEGSGVIVTPRTMMGTWVARCGRYARAGWIEDVEYTKANSFFERNADDRNRLDGRQAFRVIGNLMILASSLEFAV